MFISIFLSAELRSTILEALLQHRPQAGELLQRNILHEQNGVGGGVRAMPRARLESFLLHRPGQNDLLNKVCECPWFIAAMLSLL